MKFGMSFDIWNIESNTLREGSQLPCERGKGGGGKIPFERRREAAQKLPARIAIWRMLRLWGREGRGRWRGVKREREWLR